MAIARRPGVMNEISLTHPPSPASRLWQWLFALFAVGVLALIAVRARAVDWAQVGESLGAYGAGTVMVAALLALGAHAAAGCYDLIGRRHVGHRLPTLRVFSINAIAYAFSLNLGAMLGGWAFRVRLYLRYGLRGRAVAQIIALAIVTNWLGFVLLSGAALALWPPDLPGGLPPAPGVLRALGVLLLLAVGAYVGACVLGRRRNWSVHLRGVDLRLPTPAMAGLQLLLSTLSWLLMTAALACLLPGELPFSRVLVALFVSSIAGAAFHVPGGVGVLEAGVTEMLSDSIAETEVLAAVLTFRAVYYLLPFALACAAYAFLEIGAHRRAGRRVRAKYR